MRLVLLAVVAFGCANSSKDAAPVAPEGAAGAREPAAAEPAAAESAAGPTTGGGGGAPSGQAAPPTPDPKEAARTQGLLGPSDQDVFRPLEEEAIDGASRRKAAGGGAAFVATLGAPLLESKQDSGALLVALNERTPAIQRCYDTARAKQPALAGELMVTFMVKPDRTLGKVEIQRSTLKHASLEACVVTALEATKLASPLGALEVRATLPIRFAGTS